MAFHRPHRLPNRGKPRSSTVVLAVSVAATALLFLASYLVSTSGLSFSLGNDAVWRGRKKYRHTGDEKYLYWGNRIDCPGKHCDSCEGLGHQESSLRCALEEAMFLQRYSLRFFCLNLWLSRLII